MHMMHADEGQRTQEHHDGTDRFSRQIIASLVAAITPLPVGLYASSSPCPCPCFPPPIDGTPEGMVSAVAVGIGGCARIMRWSNTGELSVILNGMSRPLVVFCVAPPHRTLMLGRQRKQNEGATIPTIPQVVVWVGLAGSTFGKK